MSSLTESAHGVWNEGAAYLKVVRNAWPGKAAFTPDIMYQVSAMAIEKMLVAWMMEAGELPENHTLRDLVRHAQKLRPLPEDLRRDLVRMDRFMDLCPLVPMNTPKPQSSDVPEFLRIAAAVEQWVHANPVERETVGSR